MSGVIVDLIYRVNAVPLAGDEAVGTGFNLTARGASMRWWLPVRLV